MAEVIIPKCPEHRKKLTRVGRAEYFPRRMEPTKSDGPIKHFAILVAMSCLLGSGCEEPVRHYNRINAVSLTGDLLETPVSMQGKAKPYGTVKLFRNKAEIPGKYSVLALMTVSGDPGDEALFIRAFLYRAADIGADAVLLDGGPVGTSGFDLGGLGSTGNAFKAEAIRLEESSDFAPFPPKRSP
jgi:hypothetical protein